MIFLVAGLEEFEDKMERLGVRDKETSGGWLNSIIDQLVNIKEELMQEVSRSFNRRSVGDSPGKEGSSEGQQGVPRGGRQGVPKGGSFKRRYQGVPKGGRQGVPKGGGSKRR